MKIYLPMLTVWMASLWLSLTPATAQTKEGLKIDASPGLAEITHIKLWLGKNPGPGKQGVGRGNEKLFILKDLKIAEAEAYDSQLQTKLHYRGINLRDLIALISPMPPTVDIIILHTSNGLRIPVAIKDLTSDRQIFLATSFKKDGQWSKEFPTPPPTSPKGVPLVFLGNKLVAGTQYQVKDSSGGSSGFSLWDYAASLTGVEAVESRAYYQSFNRIDGKSTSLGHTLFQGRCWSCHNVKGEGGQWGPDLTTIKEIDDIKGIKQLSLRVAGPKSKKDQVLSHSMPYQKDITLKELKSLWFWLREIKASTLAPYDPTYEKSVKWE